MSAKKIILFGGVGSPLEFGGELSKNKEIVGRLTDLGCDITIIDTNRAGHSIVRLLKVFLKFFACALLHPKATFIFSTAFKNIYPLFKILYFTGIRLHIVYWAIGGNFSERVVDGAYKQKYVKLIDLFIVEGLKMKNRLAEVGFNNAYYAPNFKRVGELPAIHKFTDGKIHFLFISRIIPDKGCRYILNSVASLNNANLANKFVVDFYGTVDSSYAQEFNATVAALENANYNGSLTLLDESNYNVLAKYHYMLFPTYWYGEGFPGVVIDAYKAGVPVIASDFNLNQEFVKDGGTGIIVPVHDEKRLTEAMRDAIEGKFDCEAMSRNCQKEVAQYDTAAVINAFLFNAL